MIAIVQRMPGLQFLQTLHFRILCVLAVGLLIIQIASFSLVTVTMEDATRGRMLDFMTADTVLAYDVLQRVPAAERDKWVRRLNRGFYSLWLAPLSAGRVSATGSSGLTKLDRVAHDIGARLGRSDVALVNTASGLAITAPLDREVALYISAEDPLPMPGVGSLVWYSMVLTLTVIALSMLAVRIAFTPMRTFIQLAQRLGRDINAVPLQSQGPIELQRMAQVFNQMQSRIRKQMEERVQIIAAISHDLQTPITRLRLRADKIIHADLRNRMIADLDVISEMVRDALGFVKSASVSEPRAPINVNALVESIISDMTDMAKRVTGTSHVQRPYFGARRSLHRALQNVLENAVKFGDQADVSVEENADGLAIRVTDNGPGIPDDMLEAVFEPFLRVRNAETAHLAGNGLGLSIARNLVRAHQGKIELANLPAGGLGVCIFLPWPSAPEPHGSPTDDTSA